MTRKNTLYLANPYGFSGQQRAGPLAELAAALDALGAEIWEPFARKNQVDKAVPGWAWRITLALAAALVAFGGATVSAENRKPVFQCDKDWITVKAADSQFVFATAEPGAIVTFRKTDVIQVTSTSIALRIGKTEGLFDVSPKMADQVRHCLTR